MSYAMNYTTFLESVDCDSDLAMQAATDCESEVQLQMQATNDFLSVVDEGMETLGRLECIQNRTFTDQIPICPFGDTTVEDVLSSRTGSDGITRRLIEFDAVLDFLGGMDQQDNVFQPGKTALHSPYWICTKWSNGETHVTCMFLVHLKQSRRKLRGF